MKKIISGIVLGFVFAGAAAAQVVPAKIKKFLDDYYTSAEMGKWQQAPGACDGKKWFLSGDFNNDGRTDYLARILTGKGSKRSLHLIGFINQKGEYTPDPFSEEEYVDDIKRTATSLIKKGTEVSPNGEGEGPLVTLTADAITQYICETDASNTYIYKDGEFRKLQNGDGNETVPAPLPQVFPTPKPTPKPTPTATPVKQPRPTDNPPVQTPSTATLPNIVGSYRIYKADGKVDASGGTVLYENGVLTFKISDGRAFSSATAFVKDGVISTGWGRTATVSPDGQTIFWSDKTRWVRR
ncbi:MAG TPA: hypothetical protein PLL77_07130 [Pyrinomonadaceae bacterium]|nr:hypothetical protein [Pyrinomonadaceae bacterium]